MTLEEADKIRKEYIKFMEVAHPGLMRLFQTTIPESTLPYPKKQIEQAMDICIKHLETKNDKKMAKAFGALKVWLRAYTDDGTALTMAYNRLVG
jgi:hypothetical protein